MSGPAVDEDERMKQRKEHHNRLERQRRDDIKLRFNELQKALPPDAVSSKASRAKILTAVADYITEMRGRNEQLESKKRQLQKQLEEVRSVIGSHQHQLQQYQQPPAGSG
eukprot:gene8342-883_t